jgi:protein O-mannosyl-transferase
MGRLSKQIVPAGLILMVVVAVFWNGLYGSFFFDDEANVLQVESLRLNEITLAALQEAWNSGIAGLGGRPVAQLSFALNHYFSGFDPFAFKATNLVFHLLTGVLVFFVAQRLLVAPIFAGVAAALWLLHPIQMTSVLYVVQRMTSLSALFVLAGCLLHIIGRERGGHKGIVWMLLGWLVCWPLAFFSKEIAILFPLLVLVWELVVRRAIVGRLDRFALTLLLVLGLGAAASLSYLLLPASQWLWAGYEMRGFTMTERLLTEGRVLWLYLGLIVFPRLEAFSLYHDDIPLSTSLLDPWTTLPAWLGLIALAWMAWRLRQRAPLLSFGIAWFLVGHLLESTVLPLEIAHEHRNYLPSFGLFIAAAWALMQAVQHPRWQKTLGITVVAVYALYATLLTGLRSHLYGDEIRRTQIESQHHPESARTHYEAGRVLVSRVEITSASSPQYFFARKHYERAGQLEQGLKVSWLGLIHLNCQVGASVETAWIDELANRLHASSLGPGDRNVLYSVKEMAIAGTLCLPRANVTRLFEAAITNATASPHVKSLLYSWLADYLTLAVHDLPAAQVELDKSLAIAPHNPSNRLKRAQLAFLQGRHDEARALLESFEDDRLARSDREILDLLISCLGPDGTTNCIGR